MNNKKIYNDLIKILIKKAKGFYYKEEQEDYEKTQNKNEKIKNQCENISFFDKFDMVDSPYKSLNDKLKSQNENKQKDNSNLVMVKKKITTHYIPPDMLAVKILFETIKEKVNNDDIENLTDDELLKLKENLLGELINENKQN